MSEMMMMTTMSSASAVLFMGLVCLRTFMDAMVGFCFVFCVVGGGEGRGRTRRGVLFGGSCVWGGHIVERAGVGSLDLVFILLYIYFILEYITLYS